MICPDNITDEGQDRLRTQYRESDKFIALLRHDLDYIQTLTTLVCAIPELFDLDTALGEQLTWLGKVLGFPRTHCVCTLPPVYGVPCDGVTYPYEIVTDPCLPATWLGCRDSGETTITIGDDEIYRGFLRARIYQMLGLYDITSLTRAAKHIWGDNVGVDVLKPFEVIVAPGRALSSLDRALVPIAFRVLPIAPGIVGKVSYHTGPIVGFGAGWVGACEGGGFLCPENPYAYSCAA